MDMRTRGGTKPNSERFTPPFPDSNETLADAFEHFQDVITENDHWGRPHVIKLRQQRRSQGGVAGHSMRRRPDQDATSDLQVD
jgi:hypothetical protein